MKKQDKINQSSIVNGHDVTMEPKPNGVSHTIQAHLGRNHVRQSSSIIRKKRNISKYTSASIAALGSCLLLLNTQLPRGTFRELIDSQTMVDSYPAVTLFADNSTNIDMGRTDVGRDETILPNSIRNPPNTSDSPFNDNHRHDSQQPTNQSSPWENAVVVEDGNLQIEYFENNNNRNDGMAACLINLEDTIKMAEWLPYHYATLSLGSLVIALDPNNSERGIQRTLELIDLWKDKIEITLWPNFFLPPEKRFRKKQAYVRERQVYFANQCLAYHKSNNRTWTFLTDNDEYVIFNYVHNDESLEYDHPGAKSKRIRNTIKSNREKYMPLRKDLPKQNESTILDYIHNQEKNVQRNKTTNQHDESRFLPRCVRLPGIRYGGNLGVNKSFVGHDVIEPIYLSTLREIHYEKRKSKFSKVMIDVSNITAKEIEWSKNNHAKTIHNPSIVCGYNGYQDSGADYVSALFRLNHYFGSPESFLERGKDYRTGTRSLDTMKEKTKKVKPSEANWDTDISSWIDIFAQKVGGTAEAKRLLEPLVAYQNINEMLQLSKKVWG